MWPWFEGRIGSVRINQNAAPDTPPGLPGVHFVTCALPANRSFSALSLFSYTIFLTHIPSYKSKFAVVWSLSILLLKTSKRGTWYKSKF